MGGTFDHLHSGHKLLLTNACFLTQKKMIIGIAADKLLQKKANKELIENYASRSGYVREFLQRLRGVDGYELDIFELTDPVGKAGTVEDIDGIILTQETIRGGAMINTQRKEQDFKELPMTFIDLMFGDADTTD